MFFVSKYFLLPVLVLIIGVKSTPFINNIGKTVGDLSYGMYIYAFPVQQTLAYFFGVDHLQMMAAAIPLSAMFAYVSWHLIEKRALRLKNWKPSFLIRR